MNYRPSMFPSLTPVVKNILIVTGLIFFAQMILNRIFPVDVVFSLHYPASELFRSWQLITYMFLHADIWHIFFNMLPIFMFGVMLERVWGPKRFLAYYLVTGIGAGLIQLLVIYLQVRSIESNMSFEEIQMVYAQGLEYLINQAPLPTRAMNELNIAIHTQTLGASGAVFGVLLAFGMLFPNLELMLLFPPMPIKAKYMVIIYGVLEMFYGVAGFQGDNVAHWAHLGGMLFGFFMIRYWRSKGIY